MPTFSMRFANWSNPAISQTWTMTGALQKAVSVDPHDTSSSDIGIDQDATIQIIVTLSDPDFVVQCNLNYTADSQSWALDTDTPDQFQLSASANAVTLGCFLTNQVTAVPNARTSPGLKG